MLRAAVLAAVVTKPMAGQELEARKVIEVGSNREVEWLIVNDGVMGGQSSSTITRRSDGIAVFEGALSLENNGGFASVRTRIPEGALVGASRILLRVKGDGRQYQLRLRLGRRFDGIAFGIAFETTAGQWITIGLPLQSFEPTFRGDRPRDVGPLRPSEIGQVGIMLKDKQDGPFRLEIDWIAADGANLAR